MREFVLTLFGVFLIFQECLGEDCATAKRWGFICLSEETTAICIYDGTRFTAIGRVECDPGTYCNEDTKNCTVDYVQNFRCFANGFYPDLGNCRKYLYCPKANAEAYSLDCPAGMMYSPTTGCCSQQWTELSCARRRVSCDGQAKVAAWSENNNYFYSCVKALPYDIWYPQLVKCPGNQIFDGIQCVDQGTGPNVNPSLPTSPTSPSTGTASCEPGSFASSEQDCRQYFYCNTNRVWVSYRCATNSRFDLTSRKCRIGSC